MTTCAPFFINKAAVANPMPELPPVISIFAFFIFILVILNVLVNVKIRNTA
jgi:hypothetical protein